MFGTLYPGQTYLGGEFETDYTPPVPPVFTTNFGRLVTRWDVENATTLTIGRHLQSYLAGMWAQHPSAGPVPLIDDMTISGGLDFQTWMPERGPGVIVNAKPTDESILLGSGQYYQWYDVSVATIVQAGDEDEARRLADLYGAAVAVLIGQHGDLAGLSENTTMTMAPTTSFPDKDERRFAMSESSFRVLVPAFDASQGTSFATGTVASVHVGVQAWPLDEELPADTVTDGRADTPPYSEPVY